MAKSCSHATLMRIRAAVCAMTVVHLFSFDGVVGIKPKFPSSPVTPGKEFGHAHKAPFSELSTNVAIFIGTCSPEVPFEFHLSAGSGRGTVGISSTDGTIEIGLTPGSTVSEESTIDVLNDESQDNLFGFEDGKKALRAIPFDFKGIDDNGGTAQLKCSHSEEQVLVVIRDDSGISIEASNTFETVSDGQKIKLQNGVKSNKVLYGNAKKNSSGEAEVEFSDATKTEITLHSKKAGKKKGSALVHLSIRDESGKLLHRTLVTEVRERPKPPKNVNIKTSDIDENGDVKLTFIGVGNPRQSLKYEARVGLIRLDAGDKQIVIDIADVTAILPSNEATLVVHGGWIRRILEEHNLLAEEHDGTWDVVVKDALVTDPEDSYEVVGILGNVISTGLGKSKSHKVNRRGKLAIEPTNEERDISNEMRRGRQPKPESKTPRNRARGHEADDVQGSLRALSGTHRRILVHGYCASVNPFPMSHFTNDIAFSDPDTSNPEASNWSHDTFARKIDKFGDNQGLHGCACIAHSQGGAACLHLYSYYWSCLDYSSTGTRMIQSVGTPYLGTNLAGILAALGGIFGAGCGTNNDLTYSGASNWWNSIPIWAEDEVYYYTTTFEWKWWRYDYCHLGTDPFLSDPEDGTTEKQYGQLPYGHNAGHKEGQCHTTGMRDPAQYLDYGRNVQMNNFAKY